MNLRRVRGLALIGATAGLAVTLLVVDKTNNGAPSGATDPGPAGPPSSRPAVPSGTPAGATPTPAGKRSPKVSNSATPDPRGHHRQPATQPITAAATEYLRVFFDRRMTSDQWRARLAKLSTASHATTIASVPRVAVPTVTATRVTPLRIASSAATVQADLSDRSVLHVGLVLDEQGWKVARVVPYRKVVTQ